jgi:hypothetical protein
LKAGISTIKRINSFLNVNGVKVAYRSSAGTWKRKVLDTFFDLG